MRRNAFIFILIALAQLAVPSWMIVEHERVLREGQVFKFRTAPIDPRDPFRGEYVALNFEAANGSWHDPRAAPDSTAEQGPYLERRSYAILGVSDTSGYAFILGLGKEPPASGPYVSVSHWSSSNDPVSRVELPFDRYYLEEGDGAKTESMLMPQWNDGIVSQPLPAYAVVRVYKGQAVIEDLIVGERSIHDWLEEVPSD